MNRFFLTFLLPILLYGTLTAQDYENCAQVIGTTGKFAQRAGKTFFYTVGEPVILTLKSQRYTLTQGFHQPDLCISVATDDLDLAAWQIEVFPNPTTDVITIRFDEIQGSQLILSAFNLLGQSLISGHTLASSSGSVLDCSNWQSGIYILNLRDPKSDKSATIRVVRL